MFTEKNMCTKQYVYTRVNIYHFRFLLPSFGIGTCIVGSSRRVVVTATST